MPGKLKAKLSKNNRQVGLTPIQCSSQTLHL